MQAIRLVTLVSLILTVGTLACGGSDSNQGAAAQAKAEAEAKKQAEEAEQAKAIAERKAKREAEEKAKAEAEAKITAQLETLCVVPDKYTKDPVKGCEDVGKAYDAFMLRVSSPEAKTAWEAGGNEKGIAMTVVQCTQADSAQVAACQKNALDAAGPELADAGKTILRTCIDKFAAKRPGAGAAVPKRRPG